MIAWQIAEQWHKDHSTEDFSDRIGWNLSCGYVWSSPEIFMLAQQVRYNEQTQEVSDDGEANCWFIELAAAADRTNAVSRLFDLLPHPMPWVCWRRDNGFNIKAYRWDHLSRKVG